jgi:nucleoside-diphosphate-sugar epimerase
MGLKNKKINMLTSGNESREFLYADDCSMGLSIIMNKFNYFFKKKNELHLTTSKKIKIIDIAKIIKKILSKRKINISIKPSDKKDVLQNNINNEANKFLLRYWKPKTSIEGGVEKIVNYYENI